MTPDNISAPETPAPIVPPSEPPKPVPVPLSPERDIEENKDLAAFSYLWIMSVIVYFLKKESPFVRFHAKQAMILFVLTILAWLVPFGMLSKLLQLIILAGMVIGFLGAAQGQWKDVPAIGPLSRREVTLGQAWHQFIQKMIEVAGVIRKMFKRTTKYTAADDVQKKPAGTPPTPPPSTPTPPPSSL